MSLVNLVERPIEKLYQCFFRLAEMESRLFLGTSGSQICNGPELLKID